VTSSTQTHSSFKLRNPISGLTHFIGAVAAIVGLVVLVVLASVSGTAWHVTSFAIYGSTLVMLYVASTLYHWLPLGEKGIARLRKVDHTMIFLLIAGTYTPICLTALRGPWGFTLFGIIWGLAVFGIATRLLFMNAPRVLYVGTYLVMGWVALIFMVPIMRTLPGAGIFWLFAGGGVYSVGAVCYATRRPDPIPGVFGFHEIWHLFVMGGSFCHFYLIYRYLIV